MPSTNPGFTPDAIAFLRALKRNNDREWFKARQARYDAVLRGPMIALIDRLARDFRAFAPELVASPKTSLYRIYRDTRFSGDKAPLKTQISAVFPCRGLAKHQGAGLYIEIAPRSVWVGGGIYAPDSSQLHIVREHIASNTRRFRAIVESRAFLDDVGPLDGARLQRVPRGFPRDHQAAEYLKFRQFLAGREFPSSFASSPKFYRGILKVFRRVAPLVQFLNQPLLRSALARAHTTDVAAAVARVAQR
jgi:uncharacterized protein (TIGR02453 family)